MKKKDDIPPNTNANTPGDAVKTNTLSTSLVPFDAIRRNTKVTFDNMVFVFMLCATIGFMVETIFVYLSYGIWANRGMTYGPYCTIYGVGGLILYLFFHNVKASKSNIPYTFFATAITMGLLELISGLFLKHVLGIEMWNYDAEFLPILHYTSVPIMIGWGILATFYVFFLQPLLLKIISLFPVRLTKRLAVIMISIYFCDLGFSFFNIYANPELLYRLVNPNL